MAGKSSPDPALDVLRARCRAQGVEPSDEDLAAAAAFVAAILPVLREIEESIPAGTPAAGLPPEGGEG